jgi:hypothetical protein
MHTVDLTGTTDDEIITIITNAGRTAEKWDEAKKNLGLRRTITETRKESSGRPGFEKKENRFDKPKVFKKMFQERRSKSNQKPNNKSKKTYAEQTEAIDKSELDRRKVAGECQDVLGREIGKEPIKLWIVLDGLKKMLEQRLSLRLRNIRSLR